MGTAFKFERRIDAPIEVVWELLSNHEGYKDLLPLPTAKVIVAGEGDRNGVGAVRQLGAGPIGAQEKILAFDPPHHMAYTVTKGLPIRDYRADVRLSADGEGTAMVYEGDFTPIVPGSGPIVGLIMSTAVRQIIGAITKAAEARREAN